MLYYIFKYLDEAYNLPGSGMFQYISFRAAASIILALLIVIIFGRKIIDFLRRKQIGEEVRDLGLEGQLQKRGTPTMGGVIRQNASPSTALCTANTFQSFCGLVNSISHARPTAASSSTATAA